VLESTSRIIPLPELIQASNTAALFVVANFAIGTDSSSKPTATKPAILLRRTKFLVI
jgi:hypothetical protein